MIHRTVEDSGDDWRAEVTSLCGKSKEILRIWSRKWWRIDGKVECSNCVKAAEKQVPA